MTKVETAKQKAKQMVERTKKEIREEERKREIIQKFEEIFGFEPDRVWWDENLLKANYIVNFDEDEVPTIMRKPVTEVSFWLVEQKFDVGYDLDWNFWKEKEKDLIRYRWTRKLRKYIAVIDIITSK